MMMVSRKIRADRGRIKKKQEKYRIYTDKKLWAIHVDDSDMGQAIALRLREKELPYLGKIGYRGGWGSIVFGLNFAVSLPKPLSRQEESELTDILVAHIDEYRACPLELDERREYRDGVHDPELRFRVDGWELNP